MKIIKEITKLKNFASFEDYEWDCKALNDFEKYNLFYGLNGSGKTTLSRLFYFLNEGMICHEGHYDSEFGILLNDNSLITQYDNNALKGKICVFNDLFIENYLDFKTVKSKKIVYFSAGKDAKMLLEYKKDLERRKQIIANKLQKVKDEYSQLDISNKKIYGDFQDSVVNTLDINKNKFKITNAISTLDVILKNQSTIFLSNQEIDNQRNLYAQTQLPILDYSYLKSYPLTVDDIEKLSDLLKEKIERKNLSDLRDEIADWLNNGITYQNEQSNGKCIFCNQPLHPTIWQERIKQIFHMTEKDAIFQIKEQTINRYISEIQNILMSSFNIKENINQFYPKYKVAFSSIIGSLQSEFDNLKNLLEKLISYLTEKLKDTKRNIDISEIMMENNLSLYNNLVVSINNINRTLEKFEDLFTNNNQHSRVISSEQTEAFNNICSYCATSFVKELLTNHDALKRNEAASNKYISLFNKIETKLKQKAQELANSEAPINEINDIIQQIMGKNKFYFDKDGVDGQYRIKRIEHNKINEAINLSEGERNIISFAFFITYIKEKIEDSIIVIDDPISSLDSSYFFNILNLLLSSRLIRNNKLKQIFILTHNFYFFKKLRKNIKGQKCPQLDANGNIIRDSNGKELIKLCKYSKKQSLENKQIYQIVKSNYASSIQPPSDYLRKYNSEYLTLIEQFIKYKNNLDITSYQYDEGISVLNTMRRILETFLENKYPTSGGEGFNAKFQETITKLHRDDLLYLADILNIGSHGDNPFPSLNYTKYEDFSKLTDDYLDYIKSLDIDFYSSVFEPLLSIHMKP
ncbi:MAG: AAA family ATPase [Alphaproteobacteria bacterium]|nr:AAA family ATPase [Alphaproteobacteria bacterium]